MVGIVHGIAPGIDHIVAQDTVHDMAFGYYNVDCDDNRHLFRD